MARAGTAVAIVGILIIILIGAALGYTYFTQNQAGTKSTSSTSSSSTTTKPVLTSSTSASATSVSRASSTSSTTSSPVTTSQSKTTTTSTTSHSATTSTVQKTYSLNLTSSGLSPVVNSTLKTPVLRTSLRNDNATTPYLDNGFNWVISGDFEPSVAYFFANSSGLTLVQETQNAPHHEWDGDHEENVSELSGVLYGIPLNATTFSIDVVLPNYSTIFANCPYDHAFSGCSYQGQGPVISANWALNVFGQNFDNSIAVSVAEGKQGMTFGAGTASIVNGKYVGGKFLGGISVQNFTSHHTLTISTDRKSYLELYVDNYLIYRNTSLPISLNGTGIALNFYQFTSVNNETMKTTWTNFTSYSSSSIFVGGLSPGMTVEVNGLYGFNSSVSVNSSSSSNGVVVMDVAPSPNNLTVKVLLNGTRIAEYSGAISVGAKLELLTKSG